MPTVPTSQEQRNGRQPKAKKTLAARNRELEQKQVASIPGVVLYFLRKQLDKSKFVGRCTMKRGLPLAAAILFFFSAAINFYVGVTLSAYKGCIVAGSLFCIATIFELKEWNKRRNKE